MWAAYDAATNLGGTAPTNPASILNRGPTGAEGGADYELRGSGWMLRSRAEDAFASVQDLSDDPDARGSAGSAIPTAPREIDEMCVPGPLYAFQSNSVTSIRGMMPRIKHDVGCRLSISRQRLAGEYAEMP